MYHHLLLRFFLILLTIIMRYVSHSEIGTSGQYNPPFLPTACYGNDSGQFPSNNLFAAAGDEIWDSGAACGRIYVVKCISGTEPGTCVAGEVIQVKIVDYAITSVSRPSIEGSTMVLSATAFRSITNSTADSISIEFKKRCLINKKWLLSIFQKANWTCKTKLKAEFESWTPKLKDTKVELGTDTWSVGFQAEVGVFTFIMKAKFPHLCNHNSNASGFINFCQWCLINKKWLLSIFQIVNWTCKLKLKAEFESWTPKIKHTKVEFGTDTWSVGFQAEVGVFTLIVKAKFPHLWNHNSNASGFRNFSQIEN